MPETGYSNGINGKLGSGSLFSQTNAGKHTHLGAPIVVGTQPHSTKTQGEVNAMLPFVNAYGMGCGNRETPAGAALAVLWLQAINAPSPPRVC